MLNIPIFIRRFDSLARIAGNGIAAFEISLEILIVTAALVLFLLLISFAGRVIFKAATSIIILFSAMASYYMTFYNVIIGYGIIISILTTDVDMTKEIIGFYSVGWILLFGVVPVVYLNRFCLINTATFTLVKSWQGSVRILLIVFFCAALIFSSLYFFREQRIESRRGVSGEMPNRTGVVFHSYVPSNWLAGLGVHVSNVYEAAMRRSEMLDPAKKYSYKALPANEDTFVVFVIGETARYDHMSLFGYERDTDEYLKKEKNIVAIKGISSDTITKLSLRTMFVRDGGYDKASMMPREENVFSVLKSLGFSSELFAMQGELWFYNSVKSDFYKIREVIASEPRNTGKPIDDMLLIPELEQSINRHPKGKHLVILHTKGQHYLYTNRYPRSFAKFLPECMGVDDSCNQEQLFNSFDNSLLYTDYFLSNVIKTLKNKKALIFYTSDHGESIGENTHLHGTPKEVAPPEQRMVPFIIWASDKFLDVPENRSAFERLKTHQGEVHRHEEMFDTLLGCLGYTSPDNGINPKNNWCQ